MKIRILACYFKSWKTLECVGGLRNTDASSSVNTFGRVGIVVHFRCLLCVVDGNLNENLSISWYCSPFQF
jgi:hypothetical protein